MRRSPRRGWGADGIVVFSLEDVAAPAGEDPKAVIRVLCRDGTATTIGGGVPLPHRGHGYGRRLARQVRDALRAEGITRARIADPGTDQGRRMLVDLGYTRTEPGMWELDL
jgi:GNAT superfamily N-acetyltransferase